MADKASWEMLLCSKDVDIFLEQALREGELDVFPEVTAMVGFGGHGQGHKDLWDHTKKVVKQTKPRVELRWAALFHDVGKVQSFSKESGKVTFHQHEYVSARLFKKAMQRTGLLKGTAVDKVYAIIRGLALVEGYSSEWTDSAVRRVHRELGEHFTDTLLVARADVTSKHAHKRERVHFLASELEKRAKAIAKADAVVPPLPKGLGQGIMQAFGLKPSKKVGDLMKALEAKIEAGELEGHKDSDYYVSYLVENRSAFNLED